jgi:DNA-binding XRE family transcriptional regulator
LEVFPFCAQVESAVHFELRKIMPLFFCPVQIFSVTFGKQIQFQQNWRRLSSIKCDSANVYVLYGFFLPNFTSMDTQYRKRVAKNVRRFREKMALSQESLAERADMHWTYISGIERAKYNLSLSSLVRIAKALGREPYELLK